MVNCHLILLQFCHHPPGLTRSIAAAADLSQVYCYYLAKADKYSNQSAKTEN